MSVLSPPPAAPDPEAVQTWGHRLLLGLLVLGLASVLTAAWLLPEALPLLPVVLVAAAGLSVLVRYPHAHLCAVLGGFVIIFNYDPGIQLSELLFGLYYLSYLAGWFLHHAYVRDEPLLRHPIDLFVALYLVYASASLALTPIFGGSLFVGLNEWRAVMVLAFYFPIRDAARDPKMLRALLFTFVFIAVFVAARNFMQYVLALQDVGALWEVIQNRHRVNERLVMMALLGALLFVVYYARTTWMRIALLGLAAVFTASIMLGRSRTIWLAIGLAMLVVFVLAGRRDRIRFLLFGASGFVLVLLVGTLVFSDLFLLVLSGLGDRFSTIGTAGQRDVSMINRFYEWRTVWGYILDSPVAGHGFGVPYRSFSLIYLFTEKKTYVHNAYFGILYRHGFIGLTLVLLMFGGALSRGVAVIRQDLDRLVRSTAFTATASVAALAVAGLTEEVLLPTDGVFAVMFPIALLAGLSDRPSHGIARP